ncbi:hypothetical protein, unknown function [Leishmania tarentolae]|uniref:Uncharacterized protein n=1 Tax=Leishmania tarentolae TaxID=5689 RepID=A0A640KNF8_LEITA|nr:hypothetical protein, unknown function [Leishmania tarentolae]
MGVDLCLPKSTTVLNAEKREGKLVAVPMEGTSSAPAPADPVLLLQGEVEGQGSGISRSTVLKGCHSARRVSSARVHVDKDDSAHRGALPRLSAEAQNSIMNSSFPRGADAPSHMLTCSSATRGRNMNCSSHSGTCAGNPESLSTTDMHTITNGLASHSRSILRPSSGWTNSNSSLAQNQPESTEHLNLSQSLGLQTTCVPSRGNVCFLDTSEEVAQPQGMEVNEWSNSGDQERWKGSSHGLSTSASILTAQGNRQRAARSPIAENAGSGVGFQKKKGPNSLSPALTVRSVSGETPSPWPSVEETYCAPSHTNGVFKDLACFSVSDNRDRLGVFGDNGGGEALPPAAALLNATSHSSQSPKSILLRSSASTSVVGNWGTECSASLPSPDSVSPGLRRVTRGRQNEQEDLLSEKRPSFSGVLPHLLSGSRLRGRGRDEDNSVDDEHIVASVGRTMMRLQGSDGLSSVCSRSSSRLRSRRSSAEISAHALRTAGRIRGAMLSVPKALERAESNGPVSSSTTAKSGPLETGS